MLKGFAIAFVCVGILAAVDHELWGGQHIDQVLMMLGKIGYSFGF